MKIFKHNNEYVAYGNIGGDYYEGKGKDSIDAFEQAVLKWREHVWRAPNNQPIGNINPNDIDIDNF